MISIDKLNARLSVVALAQAIGATNRQFMQAVKRIEDSNKRYPAGFCTGC